MESIERSQQRGHGRLVMHKSNNTLVVAAIVAALVIVVGGIGAWALNGGSAANSVIDSSKYQALAFVNGEQYFGRLESLSGDYFKLTDVYYVQAQQANSENSAEKKLAKLGNELHGPEDMMVIRKDQVLYFENLKPDSKVSKLISQNKK